MNLYAAKRWKQKFCLHMTRCRIHNKWRNKEEICISEFFIGIKSKLFLVLLCSSNYKNEIENIPCTPLQGRLLKRNYSLYAPTRKITGIKNLKWTLGNEKQTKKTLWLYDTQPKFWHSGQWKRKKKLWSLAR